MGLLDRLRGRERPAGERTGMMDEQAQTSQEKAQMDREAAAGEAPGGAGMHGTDGADPDAAPS